MNKYVVVPEKEYQMLKERTAAGTPATATAPPEAGPSEAGPPETAPTAAALTGTGTGTTTTTKDIEDVLLSIPSKHKNRALALLMFITRKGIDWDDEGQIRYEGVEIPQTHIVDLIRDASVPTSKWVPRGATEFYQLLSKVKVPQTLIGNPLRRNMSPVQAIKTAVKPAVKPKVKPAAKGRVKKSIKNAWKSFM